MMKSIFPKALVFGASLVAASVFAADVSQLKHQVECQKAPVVYMTKSITPKSLVAIYDALKVSPTGKVGVKISTGEKGNKHYLSPDLIKDLVQKVDGTIVECNTAYGGSRPTTEKHREVIKEHGFDKIAKVDIMDENGQMSLPVVGGKHLKEDIVGKNLANYDYLIVLSHFKGHVMGGFGGALKNTSIGIASSEGKTLIHTAGRTRGEKEGENKIPAWQKAGAFLDHKSDDHVLFIESMAEASKAVIDYMDHGKKMVYINVINNISIDCDCDGNPHAPDMHDIGIVASLDPVAVDQASVDLIYAAPDGKNVVERMESRKGPHILEYAKELGLGQQNYRLISLDK